MSDHVVKLEEIFRDVMTDEPVPPRKRTRTNCGSWDSLTQLSLMAMIEQEFGVRIADKEAVDLNSFDSALQIIEEKLAAKKL